MKRQIFAIALLFCALLSQCHAQIQKTDTESPKTTFEEDTSIAFVDKDHYVSAAMHLDDYLPMEVSSSKVVFGDSVSVFCIWA